MKPPRSVQVLIIACILIAIFLPGFLKLNGLKRRNASLAEKNKRLEVENALLKTELQRLESDPVFQEKMLREKMGVVRKDEVPVKIVPQK